MASRQLTVEIVGDAQGAIRAFTDLERKAGGLGQRLGNVGRSMTRTGTVLTGTLTAPIAGFGIAAVKAGTDFQTQMNRVRAVSGAAGEQFEALREQAKELGRTTQFTAAQAADAMGFLAMAGFDVNEIMGAMPGTLQLAAAAQLDLGQAADIVSNVLTGYGLKTEELARVNDVLVKTFTSANTDLEQLGQAMKFAGPVASGFGISIEETAAAIGLMGNAGIQASMAGTSLRGALVRLGNPTAAIKKEIANLGLSMEDLNPEMNSLEDIVRKLEESGATASQMMAIFGQRAGPAMIALVEQGGDALGDFRAELEDSGGTAKRIADVQMEGLHGATLRLKSAFEGFAIAVAEAGILDQLAVFAENAALALGKLTEWFTSLNPKTQTFLLVIAGLTAALPPLLVALGAFLIVVGAISAPILAIVLALTALGIAIAAIIIWWDDITAAIKRFINDPLAAAKAAIDLFVKFADSKFGLLLLILGPAGALILVAVKFRDKWKALFDAVRDVVANVFNRVKSIVGGAVDWIGDRVRDVQNLLNTLQNAAEAAGNVAGGIKGAASGAAGLLGFQSGGVVPGPIGAPRLAVVHGGEEVLTPAQRHGGGGITHIPVIIGDTTLADIYVEGRLLAVEQGRA